MKDKVYINVYCLILFQVNQTQTTKSNAHTIKYIAHCLIIYQQQQPANDKNNKNQKPKQKLI